MRMMKCEHLRFMFASRCASRWSWAWCIDERDLNFSVDFSSPLECLQKHARNSSLLDPSASTDKHSIAPRDQFQRIQISAELRRWLLKTIHHYSRLFATIRQFSHCLYHSLFTLFVLLAVCYSLFVTICYSLFGFSRHPLRLYAISHLSNVELR